MSLVLGCIGWSIAQYMKPNPAYKLVYPNEINIIQNPITGNIVMTPKAYKLVNGISLVLIGVGVVKIIF